MIRVMTQALKIASIPVVTLLVLAGSTALFALVQDRLGDERIGQAVTIVIGERDDAAAVAETLEAAGLIRWKPYFQLRVRLSQAEIQPGTYILTRGMSVPEIIDYLTAE